jgi:hypothetical protein
MIRIGPTFLKLSKYLVSISGQIKNKTSNQLLVPRKLRGYDRLSLSLDGSDGNRSFLVHRLVALAWIPNPGQKPTVDHIDRDRSNNHRDNLRWSSYYEQAMNRRKSPTTSRARPIDQYTQAGIFVRRWRSATELQASLNFTSLRYHMVYNGGRYKDHLFRYADADLLEGEEFREVFVGGHAYSVSNKGGRTELSLLVIVITTMG